MTLGPVQPQSSNAVQSEESGSSLGSEKTRAPRKASRWMDWLAVVLCVAAPALGGATELWAQAIIILGMALLLLVSPPRALPPWTLRLLFLIFIALACFGFLPSSWFSGNPLRSALTGPLETRLPGTLSMQPWLSLENVLLLWAGLSWATFLLCHRWTLRRRELLAAYASGMVGIALVALLGHTMGWRPTFWHPLNGPFGFFPNRGQTGLVLAAGGILCYALAFRGFRKKRRTGFKWSAAYLVIGVALAINEDRVSLILFLIASIGWSLWVTWPSRRYRSWGLALCGILMLPLVFLLEPHLWQTLPKSTAQRPLRAQFKIQEDAFLLLGKSSWHGIGLGNFESFFAQDRVHSKAEDRVRHPESDWLWTGIEMGWLVPLLIGAMLLTFLLANWPSRFRANFHFRAAVITCALLFLADSFIQVPGHRLGAVWPFLFLASLGREIHSSGLPNRAITTLYRGLGLFWMFVAIGWLASVFGLTQLPTSARAAAIHEKTTAALGNSDFNGAILQANAGLEWAPLDWQLYFQRALAELGTSQSSYNALVDFKRARLLEPNSVQVPFEEARAWLSREPSFVFSAWVETLRRAGNRKADYFQMILNLGKDIPAVRKELFSLTYKDPELLLVFLAFTPADEFSDELKRLLLEDPDLHTLTDIQKRKLFALWAHKGDVDEFEAAVREHPEWLETAWLSLAESRGQKGDFQKACELAQQYAPAPILPAAGNGRSVIDLRRALLVSSNDFASGFALYQAEAQANDLDHALETVASLTTQPNCPAYFSYFEAHLRSVQNQWDPAWQAWQRYLKNVGAPAAAKGP